MRLVLLLLLIIGLGSMPGRPFAAEPSWLPADCRVDAGFEEGTRWRCDEIVITDYASGHSLHLTGEPMKADVGAALIRDIIADSQFIEAFKVRDIILTNLRVRGTLRLDRLHPRANIRFRWVDFYPGAPKTSPSTEVLRIVGSHMYARLYFADANFRGAVHIANGIFEDQVRFDHVAFHGPVVISNAVFKGDLLFNSRIREREPNEFHSQLMIDNVDVNGDVDLSDTIFTGSAFHDHAAEEPMSRHGRSKPLIELNELLIDQSLKIEGTKVHDTGSPHVVTLSDSQVANVFRIFDTDIPRLQLFANTLGLSYVEDSTLHSMIARGNRFESLSIDKNDLGWRFAVDTNSFTRSFAVLNNHHWDAGARPSSVEPILLVSGNSIGSNFAFGPKEVSAAFDLIDLRKNAVGGDLSIFVPFSLSAGARIFENKGGVIDLSGNRVENTLFLQLAKARARNPTDAAESFEETPLDEWMKREHELVARQMAHGCPNLDEADEKQPILFSLTGVQTTTLAWDLPLRMCHGFRWEGSNFTFERFGDPTSRYYKNGTERIEQLDADFLKLLLLWRGTADHPSAEVDQFLSTYVEARGNTSDSRELGLLARKGNYTAQSGRTFETLPFEARVIGAIPWMTRPFIEGARNIRDFGRSVVCRIRALLPVGATQSADCEHPHYPVIRFLLSPSGYGSKPEWSLGLLVIFWVAGGLIYRIYRRSHHEEWARRGLYSSTHAQELGARPSMLRRCLSLLLKPLRWRPIRSPARLGFLGIGVELRRSLTDDSTLIAQRLHHLARRFLAMPREMLDGVVNPAHPSAEGDRSRTYATDTPGFLTYEDKFSQRRVNCWTFSLDSMLPVIDLHSYSRYYPVSPRVRFISHFQHVLGWWFVTNLLAGTLF